MSQPNNDPSTPFDSGDFANSTESLMRLAMGLAVSNPDDPDLQIILEQTERVLNLMGKRDSGTQNAGAD